MGLAASQARLLTITARKADCEFQSMNLSHQKLSLSRDMEKISTDYQNSLNATKLVYDYYGSGDSDMPLTYDLLMKPSVYNDYYPKLVTDTQNRVILNSSLAAAARAAGIPAEGLLGTPSSDVRNKFIEALAGQNIITANQASTIQGTTYGNTVGLGNTTGMTQGTAEITYDEMIKLLDAHASDSASFGVSLATKNDRAPNDGGFERLVINGNVVDGEHNDTSQTITLSDLLSGKNTYTLGYRSKPGEKTPIYEALYIQNKIIGSKDSNSASILDWMVASFESAGLAGTAAGKTALDVAYNAVYDLLYPNSNIQTSVNNLGNKGGSDLSHNSEWGDKYVDDKTLKDVLDEIGTNKRDISKKDTDKLFDMDNVVNPAKDYIGITYSAGSRHKRTKGKNKNDCTTIAINLNNIAQVFLTAYVDYMKGVENSEYSWQKGEKNNCNLYNPSNDDFKFTIATESSKDEEDDNVLYANFYDAMFNTICVNGWTENPQIDDKDYMGEMLKGGMAFISSISDDGFYYQGNYSTDKYILEVTDEETIAKAEAKYNTEKTKIENKEETIDMKMKNLDTEISSLTTEYDTTKSVITKAIEKSFKRYEA